MGLHSVSVRSIIGLLLGQNRNWIRLDGSLFDLTSYRNMGEIWKYRLENHLPTNVLTGR